MIFGVLGEGGCGVNSRWRLAYSVAASSVYGPISEFRIFLFFAEIENV